MANILILHSGLNGITNACIEMANRLQMDGHLVFTGSMINQAEKLKANGFDTVGINPIRIKYPDNFNNPFQRLAQSIFKRHSLFQSILNELDFQEFKKVLQTKKIDLVLVDMEIHEYIIYTHFLRIPFILINQFFSVWKSTKNTPLTSNGLVNSKIWISFIWFKHRLKYFVKSQIQYFKYFGLTRKGFIKFLMNKYNFNSSEVLSYSFPLPYKYKTLPVVSTTLNSLELDKKSRKNLFYCGPLVYENRLNPRDEKFNQLYSSLLSIKKRENKKLIVASFSTLDQGNHAFLKNLLTALGQLRDCISLVSIDYPIYDQVLKNLSNVYCFNQLPLLRVLKHADLSINHGGIHTINECIHFSVPMIIFSGRKYDQNGDAARIGNYGCGLVYPNQKAKSKKIVSLIQEGLTNSKYKNKMQELNKLYNRQKQDKLLEKYIASYLTNKT